MRKTEKHWKSSRYIFTLARENCWEGSEWCHATREILFRDNSITPHTPLPSPPPMLPHIIPSHTRHQKSRIELKLRLKPTTDLFDRLKSKTMQVYPKQTLDSLSYTHILLLFPLRYLVSCSITPVSLSPLFTILSNIGLCTNTNWIRLQCKLQRKKEKEHLGKLE